MGVPTFSRNQRTRMTSSCLSGGAVSQVNSAVLLASTTRLRSGTSVWWKKKKGKWVNWIYTISFNIPYRPHGLSGNLSMSVTLAGRHPQCPSHFFFFRRTDKEDRFENAKEWDRFFFFFVEDTKSTKRRQHSRRGLRQRKAKPTIIFFFFYEECFLLLRLILCQRRWLNCFCPLFFSLPYFLSSAIVTAAMRHQSADATAFALICQRTSPMSPFFSNRICMHNMSKRQASGRAALASPRQVFPASLFFKREMKVQFIVNTKGKKRRISFFYIQRSAIRLETMML